MTEATLYSVSCEFGGESLWNEYTTRRQAIDFFNFAKQHGALNIGLHEFRNGDSVLTDVHLGY